MGKLIFTGCALILFFGIIKSKGATRLIWFFTGIIFFQERIIVFESPSFTNFSRFLIYSLLIAELLNPKELYLKLRHFPLIIPLIIVFTGMLCIGAFDGRHNIILSLYRLIDQFIQTFFVMFLCYASFKKSRELKQLFKFFLISSIILCIYGCYVFITRSNPYDNYITNLYHSVSTFDQYALNPGERFRVNSFVSHPIYYGYLSGVLLLLSFCHYVFIKELKGIYLFAMAIIFMNLMFANSRTPLIATFFGFFIFILIALNKRAKINILIIGTLICFGLYNVPFIKAKINNSIDIFETGGEKTTGSNVDMRTNQLYASYNEFKKSPVFGNGLFYTQENLGFVNVANNTSDSEFQGFESYVYLLLIEQGSVGILVNVIFFISIGVYFFKNIHLSKQLAGLGLAILIMFLIFIIGTGTLGSWSITMGLLGVLIANLNIINSQKLYLGLISLSSEVNEL